MKICLESELEQTRNDLTARINELEQQPDEKQQELDCAHATIQERDQTTRQTGTDRTFGTQIGSQTGTQSRIGTQTGAQTGTVTGQQTQEVTSLDEQTQAILQALIRDVGGVVSEGALPELLTARAREADTAFDVQPIIEQARAATERQVGRAETRLAGEAGSSLNSLVQQLGIEERTGAETALASLAAQLQGQARQSATQEIAGASQIGSQQLAQLVDVLKGATTAGPVQTAEQTEQSTVAQDLQELVSQQKNKQHNQK